MDIRENVVEFIENSDFDDFTKIRYIYLYVCDMFSYDIRFPYADYDVKKQIYNKKIDIKNVEEFEIVCYSYARILVDLLAVFNIRAEIVRESEYDFQHVYVIVKHQGKVLKLDPTKKHDTTRVKMHNPTLDFRTLIDDPTFSDQLIDADKHISEKSENNIDYSVLYNSDTIASLINVINQNAIKRNITPAELFFEKIDAIEGLINTRTDFTRYDDMDFYLGYLINKFNLNDGKIRVRPGIFFKNINSSISDIINILLIEYDNLPPVFYIVEKVDGHYNMRDIDIAEVQEKLGEYSNWKIDYFFKNKVSQISGKTM